MTDPRSDKRRAIWLQWGLRIVGGMGLFAAIAVVVPDAWLADAAHKLHVEYAPTPLTGYLARHVSLWYAIFGIILLVVSRDIERYRPLLRTLAYAMALFAWRS